MQIDGAGTGVYFVMHQNCMKPGGIAIGLLGFSEEKVRKTLSGEKDETDC